MSAEILDQAARERTLGVRPEVGLRSETGNNGESLRKEGGYPVHCVLSHWQSPGQLALLSTALGKNL